MYPIGYGGLFVSCRFVQLGKIIKKYKSRKKIINRAKVTEPLWQAAPDGSD